MVMLTSLALAAAHAPHMAKYADCKPILIAAAATGREAADQPRDEAGRRDNQRQRPEPRRRCFTLASA